MPLRGTAFAITETGGAVHEFNYNWIAGLKDYPSAKHWRDYGAKLATVFDEYFATVKP